MLLAAQRTTIAVPFCAQDYLSQTVINILKVCTFCALLQLPGTLTASYFGKVKWRWSILPTAIGITYVLTLFGNDIAMHVPSDLLCGSTQEMNYENRSVFIPEWSRPSLETIVDAVFLTWGFSILIVLYKLITTPAVPQEQ
ncbi:hypothetical protein [Shimia sp.]|uniref:hypothetical protein n=1 Tax=Shimia sp. TaxID=1954381 RepID=UPI003B8E63FA